MSLSKVIIGVPDTKRNKSLTFFSHRDKKSIGIKRNNSQGPEDVVELLEEARVETVSHAPPCEFQRRTGDRCVGRYFPVRLPPEGRLEEGALVGVLFGRN